MKREWLYTHGMSKTVEYQAWSNMRNRCTLPSCPEYKRYGARGITICEKWQRFEGFFEDMGKRPSRLHSLDRVDPNKGYFAANCRWATDKEQGSNTRRNVWIEWKGQRKHASDWAVETGLHVNTIYYRHRNKWPEDKIFSKTMTGKQAGLASAKARAAGAPKAFRTACAAKMKV